MSLVQLGNGDDDDLYRVEEEHPMIVGVLTVRIRSASRLHASDPRLLSGRGTTGLRVSLSCRGWSKKTHLAHTEGSSCSWNEVKHIPVVLVRRRMHPFNALRVSVAARGVGKGAPREEIGSLALHLHEIAESSPITGTFSLYRGHHDAGSLSMDLLFNYGLLGYGYAPQLLGSFPLDHALALSLYPRVSPPGHRRDPERRVLVPRAVGVPRYLLALSPGSNAAPVAGGDAVVSDGGMFGGAGGGGGGGGGGGRRRGNDGDDANGQPAVQQASEVRHALVLDRMKVSGFASAVARLRGMMSAHGSGDNQGSGGGAAGSGGNHGGVARRARLDFLHARIEAACARSEGARETGASAGGGAVTAGHAGNSFIGSIRRGSIMIGGPGPDGGPGAGGAGGGGGLDSAVSAIPPLRVKAARGASSAKGGSGGGQGPGDPAGASLRHKAMLDAFAKGESKLQRSVATGNIEDKKWSSKRTSAVTVEATLNEHVPGLQAQDYDHLQSQSSQSSQPSVQSPPPPLTSKIPPNFMRFLKPAREVIAHVAQQEHGAGDPAAGGGSAGGTSGNAAAAAAAAAAGGAAGGGLAHSDGPAGSQLPGNGVRRGSFLVNIAEDSQVSRLRARGRRGSFYAQATSSPVPTSQLASRR